MADPASSSLPLANGKTAPSVWTGNGYVVLTGNSNGAMNIVGIVQNVGDQLEEQKTEDDLSSGSLVFSEKINAIGILNRDLQDGIFVVNGISIRIPPGDEFKAVVGGTPSPSVDVSGSSKFIVSRYS